MATAAAPSFEKFAPSFEREAIALKWTDGKPVHSTYNGDQIMFTLTDNRKWFADLYVAQQITDLKVAPGEFFEVRKAERKEGNRRIVTVEVGLIGNRPAAEPAKVTAAGRNQGNAQPQAQPQNNAPEPPPVPMTGKGETSAQVFTRCYRDAVDIALATVAYAREHGMLLTPEFADVRALAATIAIQEQGGRR